MRVTEKAAKAMNADFIADRETAFGDESPMAKPPNHDPSASMV